MSASITQCPRCQTTFRVTAAQLQAAAGAVRCGSCRHLFHAVSHPLPQAAEQQPDADTTPISMSPPMASDLAAIDDDAAVFDDGFDDTPDSLLGINPEAIAGQEPSAERYDHSFLDLDDWEEEPQSIFRDLDEVDEIELDTGLDTEPDRDEQWAYQLLRELEEEELEQEQREAQRAAEDSGAAQQPEQVQQQEQEQQPGDSGEAAAGSDPGMDAGAVGHCQDTPMRAQRDEALVPLPQLRAEPRGSHAALLQLEPEPLQLSHTGRRTGPRHRLFGLLALLAALALGAQYLFFNFDRMALGPQRDRMAQLCEWLGCELPQRSAPELIRTGSLMVRSHPDRSNALVVDAIITNQAAFPQPYPGLRLVFSDLNGAVIAARSFQPHEYLAGELSGSVEMTSRQPVHIALELVDPGPQAVNYELYLESAASTGSTPRS